MTRRSCLGVASSLDPSGTAPVRSVAGSGARAFPSGAVRLRGLLKAGDPRRDGEANGRVGQFRSTQPAQDRLEADGVIVVSPYVEAEFFERVARDLRPKRLHVVIDDGCRREDRQVAPFSMGTRRRRPISADGHLVGLCQGGCACAMLAARFPDKVASLVLAGAPLDLSAGDGFIKCSVHQMPQFIFEDLVALDGSFFKRIRQE